MVEPKRCLVVGAGISGLAAALRIQDLSTMDRPWQVEVWEASDRAGGVLRTSRRDGYLIEHSADMFTTADPWALDLCRRCGLEEELLNTNQQQRGALVVRRGRLHPVPAGFTLMAAARTWPLLKSPLLSWSAKLRLAWERFVPRRRDEIDESLESFATRRLGRETYQYLVQPLIGGIYVADGSQLSLLATLPRFVDLEREHGSLTRGMRATSPADSQERGARYGMFVAPRWGMQQLLDAVVGRLPAGGLRLNRSVERLEKDRSGPWYVTAEDGSGDGFDAVILAIPSYQAARLLGEAAPAVAKELEQIQYASSAVVVQGDRRDRFAGLPPGFGFVVPLAEKRRILAGSFSSVKFAGRAPDDQLLLRTFVGGACQPELAAADDRELTALVREELAELLGLNGDPEFTMIQRWNRAMPQYHVGHLDRLERIDQHLASLPTLTLAGNAYRGVGIPFCIHSGESAADRIVAASKPQ